MRKIFRVFISLFFLSLLLGIGWFNSQFYYQADFEIAPNGNAYDMGVNRQLAWLDERMEAGAATSMQQLYPEGYLFLWALYGLTWTELGEKYGPEKAFSDGPYEKSQKAIKMIDSAVGREIFDKNLSLPYGAFYFCWLSYLQGKHLAMLDPKDRDTGLVGQFKTNCQILSRTLNILATPFPESYPGKSWPSDILPGVAALSIHDKLYSSSYKGTIQSWLAKVKEREDELSLIPHSVDPISGKAIQSSRGCSTGLTLSFLKEIAPDYGWQKFELYKKHFLTSRLGIPAIREYPEGVDSNSDVDSGPVIWGVGTVATIVGLRVMYLYRADDLAIPMRNSLEAFGFATTWSGKKRYLFGYQEMADAFLAWGHGAASFEGRNPKVGYWKWQIQLISLLLALLILWPLLRIWKIRIGPKSIVRRLRGTVSRGTS